MILDYLASKIICSDDLVVVSPDVGGVARARAFAKKLSDAPLAIVDKRRYGHNVAEVMLSPKLCCIYLSSTWLCYYIYCYSKVFEILLLEVKIKVISIVSEGVPFFFRY